MFGFDDVKALWADGHGSKRMLPFRLDEATDAASGNAEFIRRSVEWIVSRFHVLEGVEIADFGCGPGLCASRPAERGADVPGIDFPEGRSNTYGKGRPEGG